MTNNKVASYAERIERLLDERATIDVDIADIYQEVKSADLKPKVLRKAIANKRRKVDKQFEADVEEYAALMLALPGATYRGVAEQTGIPKSTLQRRVPRKTNGTPHDPETGEVDEQADTVEEISLKDKQDSVLLASTSAEEITHSEERGDRQSPLRDGGAPVATSTAGPAVTTFSAETVANHIAAAVGLSVPSDDLTPPDFLRRVPT